MIGPLPKLYRIIIVASTLMAFAILGALLSTLEQIPVLVSGGLAIGAAVGAVAAFVTVHQPHSGRRLYR